MRIGPFEVPAWLAPVELADPERRALSRTMQVVFLAVLATIFATLSHIHTPLERNMIWLMIVGLSAGLAINHRGAPEWAVKFGLLVVFSYTARMAWSSRDGFRSIYFLVFACLPMIAAILLRPRVYIAFSALVLVFVATEGVQEMRFVAQGGEMHRSPTTNALIFDVECIFCISALTGGLLASNVRHSFRRVRETSRELAEANVALQKSVEAEQRQILALRQSEERVRLALQAANQGLYDKNVQTGEEHVSAEYATMLGYDPAEFDETYAAWIERTHPDDRQSAAATYGDYIAGKLAEYRIEFRQRTKSGDWKWILSLGKIVERDAAGRPLRMLGTRTDITERKRAEEEKAKLQAQFQHAQRMESIGRLAGGVAHDFNNLLTVINGYSQLLLARLDARDPLRATIAEIHKAGERAVGLTRQLLAFSRKQVLQPRVLDLNRVVEEMRRMLERLVGEDVHVQVALNAPCATVHADPHQFEQVIMNLAVNARDAMPDGGTLLLETASVEWDASYAREHPGARAGRYVMVAVSDTGMGMDEATQQRIFEPFFTTKEAGKGTGLGMSMVQGIVGQSGGYIEVYSQPGHGTTFKVYLPALAEAAADAGVAAAVPATGGKETVLVVEDHAEVRAYAVEVLKSYGYRVLEAESTDDALSYCQREQDHIHLLLTDVVMPNMSGRELAERLKKVRPEAKVLFMSGYTDDVILRHGMLTEGVLLIEKPFSPRMLAGRIRELLGPAPGRIAL